MIGDIALAFVQGVELVGQLALPHVELLVDETLLSVYLLSLRVCRVPFVQRPGTCCHIDLRVCRVPEQVPEPP